MYDHGGYALRFVFRHEIHGENVHVRFFAENFIVIPLEKILRAGQHDGGVRRFYEIDFYAGNDLLKRRRKRLRKNCADWVAPR